MGSEMCIRDSDVPVRVGLTYSAASGEQTGAVATKQGYQSGAGIPVGTKITLTAQAAENYRVQKLVITRGGKVDTVTIDRIILRYLGICFSDSGSRYGIWPEIIGVFILLASYFPIGRSLFDKQDLLEVIAGGFFGFKRTVIEPIIEICTAICF